MNQEIEDKLKQFTDAIAQAKQVGCEALTVSVADTQWLLDMIRGLEEQRNPLYIYIDMVEKGTDPLSQPEELPKDPSFPYNHLEVLGNPELKPYPGTPTTVTFNCSSCKKLQTRKTTWSNSKLFVECMGCGNMDEL